MQSVQRDQISQSIGHMLVGGTTSATYSYYWTPEGGACYLDTGLHPEFASPESLSGFAVAMHDRIGQRRITQHAAQTEQHFRSAGVLKRLFVLRNNSDIEGFQTWGYHCNLHIPARYIQRLQLLTAYMVTGLIWWGTGKVDVDAYGEPVYLLSSRANSFSNVFGVGDTTDALDRGIFYVKNDEEGDSIRNRVRIQIAHTDSNLADRITELKFDLLQLLVCMMEAGKLKGIKLPNRFRGGLEIPLFYMSRINEDPQYKMSLYRSDKRMTALQIQRSYLAEAKAFVAKAGLHRRYGRSLNRWEDLLNRFERGIEHLVGYNDYATKWHLIKPLLTGSERTLHRRLVNAHYRDSMYHAIYGESKWHQRALALLQDQIPDRLVDEHMGIPPQDTRAAQRAFFVTEGRRRGLIVTADWRRVELAESESYPEYAKGYWMKDPYDGDLAQPTAWMDTNFPQSQTSTG